ncbi:MAG: 30S ribosomal protein S12 methylthiotransferase RimO [Clostridiales bacterium]|jgi:ribosomal protein S12 methylthiotransferase|nr:30S ribosomal protein S12 methylthiotransferase RimO [Clostridiales bacterium]
MRHDIKVALVSLGCDKNRVDSEVMLGLLAGEGCVFTLNLAEASAIIVNTCGFLQDAVAEAREEIEKALEHKRAGRCRAVIVTGCAAQRYRELFESDEIDAVLGVHEYGRIADVMRAAFAFGADSASVEYGGRVLSTPGYYAYLKIAEGCDKTCTYCTIPAIRGPYRSRDMQSLVDEAAALAARGVKEIVLVAQDTTLYGVDIYGRQVVHELLRELSKIDGICWIRLLYCYPEHIYEDFIAEMAQNPKVLPYVDMPIQHAADRILRQMGRRSTQADLRAVIAKLRKAMPGITLRTTLIAGFPGETKADFVEMCDFIREIKFDRLGVFAYSREEGTPADRLEGHLEEKTKQARADRLMKIQQEISGGKLMEKIGDSLEVLVEGAQDGVYFGRSKADAPEIDGLVYIETAGPLEIGEIVNVRIAESTEYDLIGGLCQ